MLPAKPPTLACPIVTLTANEPRHDDALFALTPPGTFAYFLSWPAEHTSPAFAQWMEQHRREPKSRVFTVLDHAGAIVGSTAHLDIDAKNRSLEIGATWYAPAVRGTRVNPACKLLLLRHAFEELDAVRVTLKCDERNVHSQRAIAGIGAVREGVLRSHRVQQNGFVRNTVMFSVTAPDWPAVRARLERRLAGAAR